MALGESPRVSGGGDGQAGAGLEALLARLAAQAASAAVATLLADPHVRSLLSPTQVPLAR